MASKIALPRNLYRVHWFAVDVYLTVVGTNHLCIGEVTHRSTYKFGHFLKKC